MYPDRARRLGKEGYVKVRYDIDDSVGLPILSLLKFHRKVYLNAKLNVP